MLFFLEAEMRFMWGWLDDTLRLVLASVSGVNPWVLLLAVTTVFLSGILRGFVGFGSSLTIVMVLSAVVGPPAAVGIAGLSGLAPVVQLLPTAIRYAEKTFIVPFCLFMFVAAPIGTWVLVTTDADLMKVFISLFILCMVWMLYREWRPRNVDNPWFLMMAGTASGVAQGCAGVGGPPAVAVALARAGLPRTQRANVIGATIALAFSGLAPLWYHGVFTAEVITVSVASIPFYWLGTWLGTRSFTRHEHHFRGAALLALAGVGVVTLLLGLRSYFGV
jgi:uncharacterized membrane protein YfcA